MKRLLTRLSLAVLTLGSLSLPAFAGQLDDHYLAAFGVQATAAGAGALQKALLLPTPAAGEAPHCGTPLKHGLSRDWNKLEASTQKILAKQLAAPVLSGEATKPSSGGHFIIHYATTSSLQVCNNQNSSFNGQSFDDVPTPQAPYTLQSWIQAVGDSFEYAYTFYQGLGYNLPPNFPSAPFNVYLKSLVCDSEYGVTQTDQAASSAGFPYAFTSFINIDKDFTNAVYKPNIYTPLQSLQITAAHEYQHAIQYGYNYYFDIWYAEATSTWFEDELHDDVNQLYSYVPAWFNNSTKSLDTFVMPPNDTSQNITFGYGYGRWIFNRYLAEQYGIDVIKSVWEKLAGLSPLSSQTNSNGDIRMIPVLESVLLTAPYNSTLGTDFFGFAKRVYLRNWTSHPSEIGLIHPYTPQATYGTYPVNASVTLPHYSFAYYKFNFPQSQVSTTASLSITVNGTSAIRATAFIKDGSGTISEYPFSSVNGTTVSIPGFSPSSEVVLLLVNSSAVDGHNANFSTTGTVPSVTEPGTSAPASGSSGGGSGCFIATAAYGSYLHPRVQLLRDFRDNHLLTNAPGRAFVALYYKLSPPAADFIARHDSLRMLVRLMLAPLVLAAGNPGLCGLLGLTLLLGGLLRKVCLRAESLAARS